MRAAGEEWLVDSSMLYGRPLALRDGKSTVVDDPLHPLRAEPHDDGMWLVTWQVYARDEWVRFRTTSRSRRRPGLTHEWSGLVVE